MTIELTTEEEEALLRLYPQRNPPSSFANGDGRTLAVLARSIRAARKPTPKLVVALGEGDYTLTFDGDRWSWEDGYRTVHIKRGIFGHLATRLWNVENPEHRIVEVTEDE